MKRGLVVLGSLTQRQCKIVVPFGAPLLTAAQTSLKRWWRGSFCGGWQGGRAKPRFLPPEPGHAQKTFQSSGKVNHNERRKV